MVELVAGSVRREAGSLVWFEPVEPLGGIGCLAMTTRGGGQSRPPYDSLNLAFHVDDVEERVRINRRRVLSALGRRLLEPVVGDQVHGTKAQAVGELHAGARWQQSEKTLLETDALVTATRRLPLVTLVADCLPIALVDPARSVCAAVHAGWRGVADGVIESTLLTMKQTWGTLAGDVAAWIGPGIGPCCYEVGPEVAERFPAFVRPGGGAASCLDLRGAARERLLRAGLVEENLTGLDLCTSCHPELFFSHRRATRSGEKTTGRQALILWLEKAP